MDTYPPQVCPQCRSEDIFCDCPADICGSYENPCTYTVCYACGLRTQYPTGGMVESWEAFNKTDPTKLTGWQKEAWISGWRPIRQ